MLMALHTHFLPQQQYSRVYALFLAFHAFVYRWGCQFLTLFHEITNKRSWRCFSSSKIRTCRNTTIFVRRKDTTNYLSNRRWVKCSIHEINTTWKKKTLDDGSYTYMFLRASFFFFFWLWHWIFFLCTCVCAFMPWIWLFVLCFRTFQFSSVSLSMVVFVVL